MHPLDSFLYKKRRSLLAEHKEFFSLCQANKNVYMTFKMFTLLNDTIQYALSRVSK